DIASDGQDLVTIGSLDLARGRFDLLLRARQQREVGPRFRQRPRRRLAEATPTAGHHRDLSVELQGEHGERPPAWQRNVTIRGRPRIWPVYIVRRVPPTPRTKCSTTETSARMSRMWIAADET